ncbi:MAG: trypsin-like peptidase domain-containing protein, partial [Planctomycetota bacterium]
SVVYCLFRGSATSGIPRGPSSVELNTILMRSTFKIAGGDTLGTAFLVGRPTPDVPNKQFYVLVTAAHVLSEIKGDKAVLFLRQRQGEDFVKLEHPIQIRRKGKALWTQHPEVDVAVMYVGLPEEADVQLLPMSFLVTDRHLVELEIHPGDTLSCLGFPFGAEANEAGFPILRSGQIASYPLTPTAKVKSFLFDFRVFGGNSGGPVYFTQVSRTYGGSTRLGQTLQFVAGLVSQQRFVEEEIHSLSETRRAKHPLSLAVVIHADLIRETIESLPAKPTPIVSSS